MHDNEVDTDADLVRHLLRSQLPQWAHLPIERVPSAGTDNAIYRLGDELAVRMPRIDWAVDLVTKEQQWLPFLAPQLPMRVPLPVASGHPDDAFPYPWTVVQWLPGEMASVDRLADPVEAALQLANFVRALQAVDPSGGPDHHRGRPVRLGDEIVRKGIARLAQEEDEDLDTAAINEAWSRAVAAPAH